MDPGSLLYFLLFLLLGGFVVLCQNAIIELSDAKVKKGDDNSPHAQTLQRLLESPDRFASVMRVAYTFFHLCAIGFLARFAASFPFWSVWLEDSSWGRLAGSLAVVIVGDLFILIFSRGVPRRLAIHAPESLAYALAPAARFIALLFTPLRWIVDHAVLLICHLLGVSMYSQKENVTEEEIRLLMDVSEETGGIESDERTMINNIFEFDDRTAGEIMTHRTDVKFIELDTPLFEIVELSSNFGYSRIPVAGEDLDDVQGMLYVKDLLPLILADRRKRFSVKDFMRPAVFVPESTRCRDLFRNMGEEKGQIAVVVDEYGGTSGIVTMEDLLESIVGSIQDEYDNEEEEVTNLADGSYTFDGDIDLLEVERLLDVDLSEYTEEDYETLGGMLIGVLDRIPDPDEHPSVDIEDVRFTVDEANERQILRVRAEKLKPEGGQE